MKRGDACADLRLKVKGKLRLYEDMKVLDRVDRGKSNAAVGCHGVKKLMINYIFKNEAKIRGKVTSSVSWNGKT